MKLEDAEKKFKAHMTCFHDKNCIGCPFENDKNGCESFQDKDSINASLIAARTVIAARDELIAELESELSEAFAEVRDVIKQRDEARKDAVEMAELVKTGSELLSFERSDDANEYKSYIVAQQIIAK